MSAPRCSGCRPRRLCRALSYEAHTLLPPVTSRDLPPLWGHPPNDDVEDMQGVKVVNGCDAEPSAATSAGWAAGEEQQEEQPGGGQQVRPGLAGLLAVVIGGGAPASVEAMQHFVAFQVHPRPGTPPHPTPHIINPPPRTRLTNLVCVCV